LKKVAKSGGIMNKTKVLTEDRRTRGQEDRLLKISPRQRDTSRANEPTASCARLRACEHSESQRGQKYKTGLLRSLRSLAMTGVSEVKRTRGQEDKLFNESCYPEFISGSVHSEKWNLPWSKMLKRVQHDKFGFTLAEVLITLGIIGVVAAITIPGLITNYQKTQTVTKFKKVYSMLNQAYKLSVAENGDSGAWETSPDIDASEFFKRYWAPYIKVGQICDTYQACGYAENNPWDTLVHSNKRKEKFKVIHDDFVTIITLDGALISFRSSFSENDEIQEGRTIFADINGSKGPNIYGKDFFSFLYNEDGLLSECARRSKEFIFDRCYSKDSVCCGARLLKYDNWKISKDYPW